MKKIPLRQALALAIFCLCSTILTTLFAQTTWTGNTSTDWNTATNWSAGVPGVNDDVTIPNVATNDPIIDGTTAALAKSVTIETDGALTLQNGGSITIDNSDFFGIFNEGTIENSGSIIIGANGPINDDGIENLSIINNKTTGLIQIDDIANGFGINGDEGNITNEGKIIIGSLKTLNGDGINNESTFTNSADGEIEVDNCNGTGVDHEQATFTNNGKITIGANGPIVNDRGLDNEAIFINNQGAEILIDDCEFSGLDNDSGNFTNHGKITIGVNKRVDGEGIDNNGTFNNGVTGEIVIDDCKFAAIQNNTGNFTNNGKIRIGLNKKIDDDAIDNEATFRNNPTGDIQIEESEDAGIANDDGSFTNRGKITIGLNKSVQDAGIENEANFNNTQGGVIEIGETGPGDPAIDNSTGQFTNSSKIVIGATKKVGGDGIINENNFRNFVGGEIHIDDVTDNGILNEAGTFINNAKIIIGLNKLVGDNGILNKAIFDNNGTGEIEVDETQGPFGLGLEFGDAIENLAGAVFNNAGKLILGANKQPGDDCIDNQGTFNNNIGGQIFCEETAPILGNAIENEVGGIFNNNAKIICGLNKTLRGDAILNTGVFNNNAGAEIQIEESTEGGLTNGNGGAFNNFGKITCGLNKKVRTTPLLNQGNFNNNVGGDIQIGETDGDGLRNRLAGIFNNFALIKIGVNKQVGIMGLRNQAVFKNNAGADIQIDDTGDDALHNDSGTFDNDGKLTIGANKAAGDDGIDNRTTFNNNVTGEIFVEETVDDGIRSDALFVNGGKISVGTNKPVGDKALNNNNNSNFQNLSCAECLFFGNIDNDGAVTNDGLFSVDTNVPHVNAGTFNNNAILHEAQVNPIPNVVNNKLIIAPTSANNCNFISPVFLLSNSTGFTIKGIFLDVNANNSAGSYTQNTNTFIPNPPLTNGTHNLFVEIEDINIGCIRIVSWELTTQNCCDLSPLTLSSDDNDNSICQGTQVTFTALPAGEQQYDFFIDANDNAVLDNGETILQSNNSNVFTTSNLNNGDNLRCQITPNANPANCITNNILITVEADGDGDGFCISDGDCNDNDPNIFPGAQEICDGLDNNCDGVLPNDEIDNDNDGFLACEDCDDNDANTFPGSIEICDGIDNDCDGIIPANELDNDGDGILGCNDCDDNDPNNFSGNPEICDGQDNNCDGQIDEGLSIDSDGDGHFAIGSCLLPNDDCDDNDPNNFPGNLEICDGQDNNCDGQVDEGLSVDADGDGHFAIGSCLLPNDDCDDNDPNNFPGNLEVCDGLDNNCDGQIDEGLSIDADGDGHFAIGACLLPNDDCDDNNPNIFPGAPELCDGLDNNCDGIIPAGEVDNDGDGFFVCEGDCNDFNINIFPGAEEICDGLDNNCDGQIDENGVCNDIDGDGFTPNQGDCDDNDPLINPNALEICDGVDNNCDGNIDEGTAGTTFIGNVTFITQAQVDAFLPCYGIIDGDMAIIGNNISNLSALSGLSEVTGFVVIKQTFLPDFSGLDNLTHIGDRLDILFNSKLENFSGLEALTDIDQRLFIFGNNLKLTSLTGLENVTNIGADLLMFYNSALADCCAIEPLIPSGIAGSAIVAANAIGCQNVPAIQQTCNPPLPFIDLEAGQFEDFASFNTEQIQSIIFPNPAKDLLTVLIQNRFEKGNMVLINSLGQPVYDKDLEGSIEHKISLENFPGGVYFLNFQIDGKRQVKKLFIE